MDERENLIRQIFDMDDARIGRERERAHDSNNMFRIRYQGSTCVELAADIVAIELCPPFGGRSKSSSWSLENIRVHRIGRRHRGGIRCCSAQWPSSTHDTYSADAYIINEQHFIYAMLIFFSAQLNCVNPHNARWHSNREASKKLLMSLANKRRGKAALFCTIHMSNVHNITYILLYIYNVYIYIRLYGL